MKILLTIFLLSFLANINAQDILQPVKWTFEVEKMSDTEFKVKFIADIEKGWAIYSQFIEEGGPIPTTFTLEDNDEIELIGSVVEPEEKEVKYDEMFDMQLIKIKGKSEFYQLVTTKIKAPTLIGYLTFMSCDDSKCLPPSDIDFEITIE